MYWWVSLALYFIFHSVHVLHNETELSITDSTSRFWFDLYTHIDKKIKGITYDLACINGIYGAVQ